MTALAAQLRIVRHAAVAGLHDYGAIFTWKTWTFGWYVRVLAQVSFFAMIGHLVGSAAQTRFLLVGNAVVLAAMQSLGAVASSTWERRAGTLPLLVASPSSPFLVFVGRSTHWIGDALLSSLGALFVLAPLFGVALPWPRVLLVAPLVLLVALTTYAFATFLGGLVLRAMNTRNLVANVATFAMMALCGVNVPLDDYPRAVRWVAELLPLTHGLQAIRGLLDGAPLDSVGADAARELLVGAVWLVLAAVVFDRLVRHGRRDGSIEFAA